MAFTDEQVLAEFRKRLRHLLERRRMSQAELSRRIGLSKERISHWVNPRKDRATIPRYAHFVLDTPRRANAHSVHPDRIASRAGTSGGAGQLGHLIRSSWLPPDGIAGWAAMTPRIVRFDPEAFATISGFLDALAPERCEFCGAELNDFGGCDGCAEIDRKIDDGLMEDDR